MDLGVPGTFADLSTTKMVKADLGAQLDSSREDLSTAEAGKNCRSLCSHSKQAVADIGLHQTPKGPIPKHPVANLRQHQSRI